MSLDEIAEGLNYFCDVACHYFKRPKRLWIDVTVDASGEAVTIWGQALSNNAGTISDKALIKEIKRRGYKVREGRKKNISRDSNMNQKPGQSTGAKSEYHKRSTERGPVGLTTEIKQLIDMVPDNNEYWNNQSDPDANVYIPRYKASMEGNRVWLYMDAR